MFQHIENDFQQIENYFGNLIFKIYQILIWKNKSCQNIENGKELLSSERRDFVCQQASWWIQWDLWGFLFIFLMLKFIIFFMRSSVKKTTNKSQLVNVGLVGLLLQIRKLNNSKFIGHSYSHSLSHSYITKV